MTSIDELANCLSAQLLAGKKLRDLADVLSSYSGTDWLKYVSFSDVSYNRKCVFCNDMFEIYVLSWGKSQESKIHDHPESGCLLRVMIGAMKEEIYEMIDDKLVCTRTNLLFKNDVVYQEGTKALHKIINYDNLAASLHIYSPPKYVPRCYQ